MSVLPRLLIVSDPLGERTPVAQHLHGHFDVHERADSESAWQMLVIDPSIRAVLLGRAAERSAPDDLRARMRGSKLLRLQRLPLARISDILDMDGDSTATLARLEALLAQSGTQPGPEAARLQLIQDPDSGLFSRRYLELQLAQAVAKAARHGGDVSVMVLAVDGLEEGLGSRVASLLAGSLRLEDSLGHFGEARFAIVAPGLSAASCQRFAERVHEAFRAGGGREQPDALTVSIGLASRMGDSLDAAVDLLERADLRARAAQQAGGNRIEAAGCPASPPMSLARALERLACGHAEDVVPHLPDLLATCWPLLTLMDQELGLALPLAGIERRLNERKS